MGGSGRRARRIALDPPRHSLHCARRATWASGRADVAKSVDAADLKSASRMGVRVRVPPSAPSLPQIRENAVGRRPLSRFAANRRNACRSRAIDPAPSILCSRFGIRMRTADGEWKRGVLPRLALALCGSCGLLPRGAAAVLCRAILPDDIEKKRHFRLPVRRRGGGGRLIEEADLRDENADLRDRVGRASGASRVARCVERTGHIGGGRDPSPQSCALPHERGAHVGAARGRGAP